MKSLMVFVVGVVCAEDNVVGANGLVLVLPPGVEAGVIVGVEVVVGIRFSFFFLLPIT